MVGSLEVDAPEVAINHQPAIVITKNRQIVPDGGAADPARKFPRPAEEPPRSGFGSVQRREPTVRRVIDAVA
jgi:hypothetical protein